MIGSERIDQKYRAYPCCVLRVCSCSRDSLILVTMMLVYSSVALPFRVHRVESKNKK